MESNGMSWFAGFLCGILPLQFVVLFFLVLLSLTGPAKWVGISLLLPSIFPGNWREGTRRLFNKRLTIICAPVWMILPFFVPARSKCKSVRISSPGEFPRHTNSHYHKKIYTTQRFLIQTEASCF